MGDHPITCGHVKESVAIVEHSRMEKGEREHGDRREPGSDNGWPMRRF